MSINTPVPARMKPVVDFTWSPRAAWNDGDSKADGTVFQYSPNDAGLSPRFFAYTTALYVQITFTANVITAADAFPTNYLWEFGDKTIGYGSSAVHIFIAPNPSIAVTLYVTDNWNQTGAKSYPMNFKALDIAVLSPTIRESWKSTLSANLSTAAPITSIAITAATYGALAGETAVVVSGSHSQTFTLSADVAPGGTSVSVNSTTPNFAYPSGSQITIPS